VDSGTFASIHWGLDNYFIKLEMDESGGNNYQLMGALQILSVPYSLNARSLTMVDTNGLVWDFYLNPFGELKILAQNPGDIGCETEIIDPRNGEVYPVVQIGQQCWLAKNMNIGTMTGGAGNQQNDGNIEKYCYDDNPANCDTYGGLYQWDEAMQYTTVEKAQGICPDGWHIPNNYEINVLKGYLGSNSGGKLKEEGTAHWQTPNHGATNETGFTGLPAGIRCFPGSGCEFYYLGQWYQSWLSTPHLVTNSRYSMELMYNSYDLTLGSNSIDSGYSIRCIKD